ncbi:MAG: glucan biosynthesis protein, partial [Burkholderiales bacterium]|nr:glucan biosynthesis protein [Burkholderiales bacterium]
MRPSFTTPLAFSPTAGARSARRPRWRWLLATAAIVVALPALAFDFDDVAKRAAQLAERPYRAPNVTLPKTLQSLTYDQYRDIRFKPALALWR